METKTKLKVDEKEKEEGGGESIFNLIESNQRVMIQSFLNDQFLQIYDEIDTQDVAQFENVSFNHPFLNNEANSESHLSVINHRFQDKNKEKMIFYIEEESDERSIYSYQSSCIFDELLEFYAFMNVWAIRAQNDDDVLSEREKACYSPDDPENYYSEENAIEYSDELDFKCKKISYILNNIEQMLLRVEYDDELFLKCKKELVEQGILDVMCVCLEMLYYKTVPPPMFKKPYSSHKSEFELKLQDGTFNIDDYEDQYLTQTICRTNTD